MTKKTYKNKAINLIIIGDYNSGIHSFIANILAIMGVNDEYSKGFLKQVVKAGKINIISHDNNINEISSESTLYIKKHTKIISTNNDKLKYINIIESPGLGHVLHKNQEITKFILSCDVICIVAGYNFPKNNDIEYINNTKKTIKEKLIFLIPRQCNVYCYPPFVISEFKHGMDKDREDFLNKKIKIGFLKSINNLPKQCVDKLHDILKTKTIEDIVYILNGSVNILTSKNIDDYDKIFGCYRLTRDKIEYISETLSINEITRINNTLSFIMDKPFNQFKLNSNIFIADVQIYRSINQLFSKWLEKNIIDERVKIKKINNPSIINNKSQQMISTISTPKKKLKYDFFISHASEDKETFVRPLAHALEKEGYKIWYDEFSLTIGDGLRRSIDHGLSNTRFGIVVLSKLFFQKKWPQYELDGLTSIEISRGKTILPIWHNLTRDDVHDYSTILADKISLDTQKHSIKDIVIQLKKVASDN